MEKSSKGGTPPTIGRAFRVFRIVNKQKLGEVTTLLEIEAPLIAAKAQAGQFLILRTHDKSERIPLTLSDWNASRGTVTVIFQHMGRSTNELAILDVGDYIRDVVGPLGTPSHIENFGTVVCVGGGIGVAELRPIARALKQAGNTVISIIGARCRELVILEDDMRASSDELHVTTDDGSYGRKGYVSEILTEIIAGGREINLVYAIGPVPMMKVVAAMTKPAGLKTVVSLDSIMVDGTGMCGACRVTVGGRTRFTCVDGPDFDAHEVDWDELVARKRMYLDEEKRAVESHEHHAGGCCH